MSHIGMDIGSYAVKVVSAKVSGTNVNIESAHSSYNPVGQFLPKPGAYQTKLAEAIKKLLVDNKLSHLELNMALPDSEAFSTIISMPVLTDAELASAVQWEAEQYLPISLEEVNLEYAVLHRPTSKDNGDKMRVLLVAVKKEQSGHLLEFVQTIGNTISSLETASLSIARVYSGRSISTASSILVCHLGALSTDIVILQHGQLMVTHSFPIGGLALTRAVERGLSLEATQAEEYKRTYGVDPDQLEGRVKAVLLPVVTSILTEVRKSTQYYQSENTDQIKEIILSGGSAYLPGLVGFIANQLSTEVILGNPFDVIKAKSNQTLPQDVAAYTVALGLAMRQEA